MSKNAPPDAAILEQAAARIKALCDALNAVLFGQEKLVATLVTGLLARGHVLLEGQPGLGKTELVKGLAAALGLVSRRVQFTPDLLPGDITGNPVLQESDGRREFVFQPGPLFANLVLADEINRASPKTQSSLLEAMQERQVTVLGTTHPLPDPFFVMATQNPIELEGTYPLPEAQLDRFLFKLTVGYPDVAQERDVLARHHAGMDPHDLAALGLTAVATPDDLLAARRAVDAVEVDDRVLAYLVDLARATRESPSVVLGVSPRGATMLLRAAKAWAFLSERPFVTPDEVKAVALPTLRHRLQLRPEVELEGGTADGVLRGLLDAVAVPR